MSDFYWIAGTGNWSDYTNHWRIGSTGGTVPSNAPTGSDNVFFVDASASGTFTVTVDVSSTCANFDASGITLTTRKMTLAGSQSLNVSGSWINPGSTLYAATYTGSITFSSTSSGKTITTNAVTIIASSGTLTFNGIGGVWTLGGAISTGGAITFTAGSFSTANFNVTTAGNFTCAASSSFTFTPGTSTITCSANTMTFAGNGQTFYNVTFSSTSIGQITMTGSNTFNNLTFAARAAGGISSFSVANNITINGTLTTNSGSSATPDRRLRAFSPTIGTQVTISSSAISLTNTDFRDIVASGGASPFTGTSIGNLLNNSNITFTNSKTVYWSLVAGGNWNSTAWATGSGGTPAAANFPIAQDTCIIDNTGLTAGNTITLGNNWPIGTISSTRTLSWTFALGAFVPNIYGNVTFDANLTITVSSGSFQFFGQGTNQTIKSNGISLPASANIATGSGSLRIDGNLTLASTATVTLTSGAIDLTNNSAGNYTLSTGIFSSNNSNTRSIAFGTGNITLTGSSTSASITSWVMPTSTNFSFTGTPNIYLSGSSTNAANTRAVQVGITAGGSSASAMNFIVTSGSDIVAFSSSTFNGYFNNIDLYNGGTSTYSGSPQFQNINIYGNLTLSSNISSPSSISNTISFVASSGTQQITTYGKTIDQPITQNNLGATLQLQDNLAMGSTRTFTLTAGTLDLSAKTLTASTYVNTGTATRSITFNGGTISLSGSGSTVWNTSGSGFTSSAGSGAGTISLTSSSSKTFVGGDYVYASTINQGGSGALTITGSNTFYNITNSVQPATVTFQSGTTTTFTSGFSLSGTSGNLITINSTITGSVSYISKTTGVVSVGYCSIQDSYASGGATWNAFTSNGNINSGDNFGWDFAYSPVEYGGLSLGNKFTPFPGFSLGSGLSVKQ